MKKKEELNNLFLKWKEEQRKEKDAITIPFNKVDKASFTYDGFVFEEKDNTVLYILKESNLINGTKANDEFWFKEIYKEQNNRNIITRRIEKMQEYICLNIPNISNRDISYMNINKRGGFTKSDEDAMYNYYEKYKEKYIWEEIKIINPIIIIYCAKDKKIYEDLVKNIKVKYIIKMDHPSNYYISDKKYMEKFKERFNKKYLEYKRNY